MQTRNILLKLFSLILIIVLVSGCSAGQKTTGQSVKPTPGHYVGDPEVSFEVTADGQIQHFAIHMYFDNGNCRLEFQEDKVFEVAEDGTFVIMGEKPKSDKEPLLQGAIVGRFIDPTTVEGRFGPMDCGMGLFSSAIEGTWSAKLSAGGVASATESPQKTIVAEPTNTPQSTSTPVPDMTQELLLHKYTTSGWIFSQAYSPDGKTIAVGLENGSIDLLDVNSGEIKQTLHKLGGDITCMAFSPDGGLLAIGGGEDSTSRDKRVQFLSTSDWMVGKSIDLVNATSLDFSPDGKYIAAGTEDGKVKVWQVSDQTLLQQFSVGPLDPNGPNLIRSVKFSPDGNLLSASSFYDTIQVWNLSDGLLVHQFKPENPRSYGTFEKITFMNNGSTIAALHSGFDRDVYFWNMGDGSLEKQMYVGEPFDIAFSPDKKTMIGLNPYLPVNIFDLNSGSWTATVTHEGAQYVIFSPTGDTFATIEEGQSVWLWKMAVP